MWLVCGAGMNLQCVLAVRYFLLGSDEKSLKR